MDLRQNVDKVRTQGIEVNRRIFRDYDIRGVSDTDPQEPEIKRVKDLTPDQGWLIGKAFGSWIRKTSGSTILLVRDNRGSSLELAAAVSMGLQSVGCNIIDAGLGTTPMMYFGTEYLKTAGGIMVTGSHNPMWSNGFKLCKSSFQTLVGDEIQELYELIREGNFLSEKGSYENIDINQVYSRTILEHVELAERSLKVVVDTGNAVGGLFAPSLFRALGHQVTEINSELIYPFPNGAPDPEQPGKVAQLAKKVIEIGADVGIALDGDVDRVGIVDERGRKLESDLLLLLFSRDVLKDNPGAEIVFDVKCTDLLVEDIISHGGVPVMWKTGHSNIKQYMRDGAQAGRRVLLGGELSGHMFFKDRYFGFDDALYAACRLLEILGGFDAPLSTLLADLPTLLSTRELALSCPDEEKSFIINNLRTSFSEQGFQVNEIDGVRIEFGRHKWALVRASNTQPKLTARFQAPTEDGLQQIAELLLRELKRFSQVNSRDIESGLEEVLDSIRVQERPL